jgi:hypothetical protein
VVPEDSVLDKVWLSSQNGVIARWRKKHAQLKENPDDRIGACSFSPVFYTNSTTNVSIRHLSALATHPTIASFMQESRPKARGWASYIADSLSQLRKCKCDCKENCNCKRTHQSLDSEWLRHRYLVLLVSKLEASEPLDGATGSLGANREA